MNVEMVHMKTYRCSLQNRFKLPNIINALNMRNPVPRYLAGAKPTQKKEDEETSSVEESSDVTIDEKVNIHTLYKHRWVWYHMILCIQLIISNVLLVAILLTLAIKL